MGEAATVAYVDYVFKYCLYIPVSRPSAAAGPAVNAEYVLKLVDAYNLKYAGTVTNYGTSQQATKQIADDTFVKQCANFLLKGEYIAGSYWINPVSPTDTPPTGTTRFNNVAFAANTFSNGSCRIIAGFTANRSCVIQYGFTWTNNVKKAYMVAYPSNQITLKKDTGGGDEEIILQRTWTQATDIYDAPGQYGPGAPYTYDTAPITAGSGNTYYLTLFGVDTGTNPGEYYAIVRGIKFWIKRDFL
jgi:hypothetical protein